MKAKDIMSAPVLAVQDTDQAVHAVQIMADNDIGGLPVVNETEVLVGIVTEQDLLLLEETEAPRVKAALYGLWIEPSRMVEENAKRRGLLVRDVMTKKVITFAPDTPVMEVAQAMHRRSIGRVPILEGGRVVGIIARSDVMCAIAEGKSLGD